MPPGNSPPLLNTCPSCQEIIDVSGVRPYEKILCPLCGDTIRVRTVFNHFTLKAEIGQGGMSRVFRAVDNNLGREVALKILHSRYEEHPQLAAQFEREAKITASITHPHVVQVYSAGRDQGYYYIAMELLPSKSLEQLITDRGRIPEAEALRIVHEIALGLAAAFQHGMIHRDIKPGNILLDHDGRAKLVDFGLALMQGAEEDPLAEIWATPFYVPPEKLWNRPEDFRSDIYSLGAALYHMIAGRPPHCAETDSIQELITIKSQPLDLRVGAAHMHEATLQLISRMMAYDPPARYASYEELLAAIDAIRGKVDPRSSSHRPSAFPLWAKISAGLLALTMLGAVGVLISSNLKPAPVTPSPAPHSSAPPMVVSAEDVTLSQLLPRAREALLAKNFQQATTLFQELAGNERARSDWRSWAAFHLGIENLCRGDLDKANTSFAQSASLGASLDRELSAFFTDVGQVFQAKPAPPPPPGSGTAPLVCLKSLAIGLKCWLANDFPNTGLHLTQFLLGEFSGTYAWATAYRPRAEAIRADAPVLAALPACAESASIQELTDHLDRLVSIHKQLQEERSKRSVAGIIAGAEKRIASLMEASRAASSKQAMAADQTQMAELQRASLEKAAARNFADASTVWRSASWQTDAAKQSAAFFAEACDQAGRFLDLFCAALSQHPYEGEIIRTEGRSFSAKILRATPEAIVVDLGFGPTPLKMETISPAGLLKISQAAMSQGANTELGQAACFFAWFCGLESEAAQLAATLQDSPGFQSRWEAVARPASAPPPTPAPAPAPMLTPAP